MSRSFQNGSWFLKFETLISLLPYFLRPYNWLSWLPLHWAMLLVPSESSKPLPESRFIIGRKSPIWPIFFHLSFSSQVIPVLSKPYELVSSQFFSAWVEDVQWHSQKKKEDIFCWWINGCDRACLCGLMPFKLVLTWCTWIQLSIVAMLCCKLLLLIGSLHRKGAHNQCNSAANYSAI